MTIDNENNNKNSASAIVAVVSRVESLLSRRAYPPQLISESPAADWNLTPSPPTHSESNKKLKLEISASQRAIRDFERHHLPLLAARQLAYAYGLFRVVVTAGGIGKDGCQQVADDDDDAYSQDDMKFVFFCTDPDLIPHELIYGVTVGGFALVVEPMHIRL